jgi:hypothetical protein
MSCSRDFSSVPLGSQFNRIVLSKAVWHIMILRMLKLLLLFFVAILTCSAMLAAHEPDDGHQHAHPVARTPMLPGALVLPVLDGGKPWSDKPILDDPGRFSIAIMTDNTGGHRPGIWMKAVRRLNLLRPTFVMSVGDLIEGYAEDRDVIETQWDEFLGFIDEMEMRFFFVAGNHDLKNPLMHTIWREHFGVEWYSFEYKGVHFVCLCSEDPGTKLGEEQLAWIRDDLDQHKDARWTLVFLHKPLWLVAEQAIAAGMPDPTNWKQVETMLGTRRHTVFSGHVHHYVQYDRNGMKYYHLATTGGGSPLRGVPYGEFDHVTWLTMESDGPHVTHLLLDGIVPPDAVTEKGIARFREFLGKTLLDIAPILIDGDQGFSSGRINIRLTNNFSSPVEVSGTIDGLPLRSLTVDPESLNMRADPGQTVELGVRIRFGEKISFTHLAETLLRVKLRSIDAEHPLNAERTIPVIIDQSYPCRPAPAPVVLDGKLDEWPDLQLTTGLQPLIVGPAGQWQGPGDATMKFALMHDDRMLYCVGEVTDDAVTADDTLEFRLDARPIEIRKANRRIDKGTLHFQIGSMQQGATPTLKATGTSEPFNAVVAAQPTTKGYTFELAIPIDPLVNSQSIDWTGFQFTGVINDVDQLNETPSRIIWRGSNDIDSSNVGYGQITRIKQ